MKESKNISAMFARTGGLVLLSDNGIYEIKDDKLDKVIEVADEWGEISDIYGFSSTWFCSCSSPDYFFSPIPALAWSA